MGNITLSNTFTNATTADADEVNENFTDITDVVNGSIDGTNISSSTALSVASITNAGTLTQTGVATFTATPKTDAIAEKTTATGVTVDGVLLKDNAVTASGKSTFGATVQTVTAATDGATVTFDVSLGNIHTVTLGGNRTLAISNETAGQCFIVELTQDGTGSRTVTWFSTIRWDNGTTPTLTTTASKRDVFVFRCTGTDTYDGYIAGQNI